MLSKERRSHNDDVPNGNAPKARETCGRYAIKPRACCLAANALRFPTTQKPGRSVPDEGGRRGPHHEKRAKCATLSSKRDRDASHDYKSITWSHNGSSGLGARAVGVTTPSWPADSERKGSVAVSPAHLILDSCSDRVQTYAAVRLGDRTRGKAAGSRSSLTLYLEGLGAAGARGFASTMRSRTDGAPVSRDKSDGRTRRTFG